MSNIPDIRLRLKVFEWLKQQLLLFPNTLPRKLLEEGFNVGDTRIPLLGPQGIFKPKVFELPLSITTTPSGPYDDIYKKGDYLYYRYRGNDPNHKDNRGLRQAMTSKTPLIYFVGLKPGQYEVIWPVFIVADDPAKLTFTVAVDNINVFKDMDKNTDAHDFAYDKEDRRAYMTAEVRIRLHQHNFRIHVLDAYGNQCACCKLRHDELLDAAHIIPDPEPEGLPIVSNGIAMCKLHHAAFDNYIIGISPDYRVHVRQDVLDEEDGLMLNYGLQKMDGGSIILPNEKQSYPDKTLLGKRYQIFRNF
ncbi:MAG TPA: HNH endonuclease [bacterium]